MEFESVGAQARAAGRLGRLRDFGVQRKIAAGLGWLSIGLGLFELAAPVTLSRLVGVGKPRAAAAPARRPESGSSSTIALVLRGLGVREVASGVGILTRPRPAVWLWSRVVGDMMVLSLLGLALSSRRASRIRLAGATAAMLGISALDVLASLEFTRSYRRTRRSSSIIDGPAE